MTYPAFPTFPASTSTSFDDLMKVKEGDLFVLGGYEYRARGNATSYRRNGFETVDIQAVRRNGAMPSGWELATVIENRAYVGPLGEICD